MEQHRFGPGPLLDGQGNLCEPGYATALLKTYDRNAIKAGRSRIKEWDYYLITNDRWGVALTIDDNGYMGLLSASVLDFDQRTETTVSPMLPRKRMILMTHSPQPNDSKYNCQLCVSNAGFSIKMFRISS